MGLTPPPPTGATKAQGAGGGAEERMGRPRTVVPPRLQRGTAAVGDSVGTPTRHTAGTAGARPEHNALARREYHLLAPTGTSVDLADAGDQASKDSHEATRGTNDQARRETEEGDKTR